MKLRIELDESLPDDELVIRANRLGPEIQAVQESLRQKSKPSLIFYKGTSEYFLPLEDLLFFETDGAKIFAHTRSEAYEVKLKLYELEDYLPAHFSRVSKSSIVNCRAIYALDKSFSGTSRIGFSNSHKQVHVSRHYYQLLKETLREMR